MNIKDLTGQRFGMLTVIKFEKSENKNRYWFCQCDCGNTKIVTRANLTKKQTHSCGCNWHLKNKKHKNWKGYNDIGLDFFNDIKRGAIERNLEFNITIEYLWELFISQHKKCALSGIDLKFADTRKNKSKSQTASVDRIDSTLGYIVGNIQWVHKTINIMKNQLTDEQFIDFCNKVIVRNMKHKKYVLYPGRFQPPHFGHMKIFEESLNKGYSICIAIRNVLPDEKNPFSAEEVKYMWELIYKNNFNVKVIIIPDITSIKYGRDVGYKLEEIIVPADIKNISATSIRESIKLKKDDWKEFVDTSIHDYLKNKLSNL